MAACSPAPAQLVVPPPTPSAAAPASPFRSSPPTPGELAERIDAVLERPPVARALWGVEVWDPATGQALYRRNADRLFVPASNVKLVVSIAAARYIPDHRPRTWLLGTGPVRDGVLRGDLVLRGGGDPTISGRDRASIFAVWEALADSLRARGVERIGGRIIADESLWNADYRRPDWEVYDLLWWYAAPVGALGFNDNSVDFTVVPGAVGERPRITWQPQTRAVQFENRARTVAAGQRQSLDFDREARTGTIFSYGELPAGAASQVEHFAVDDPARYAGTVFQETLQRRGVRVDSAAVRVRRRGDPAPVAADTLAVRVVYTGPGMERWIGPILSVSQNWYAEMLLKALGHQLRGDGSWEAGLAVERRFLTDEVGVDSSAFRLRDGSGLSAGNLLTPHALVQLLTYAQRLPRWELVRNSLPVSGQSGSLRGRLTDLSGRVRAKTGSIANVHSLSGYVTTADGRELVFSVVANGAPFAGAAVRGAIDEVVREIARTRR